MESSSEEQKLDAAFWAGEVTVEEYWQKRAELAAASLNQPAATPVSPPVADDVPEQASPSMPGSFPWMSQRTDAVPPADLTMPAVSRPSPPPVGPPPPPPAPVQAPAQPPPGQAGPSNRPAEPDPDLTVTRASLMNAQQAPGEPDVTTRVGVPRPAASTADPATSPPVWQPPPSPGPAPQFGSPPGQPGQQGFGGPTVDRPGKPPKAVKAPKPPKAAKAPKPPKAGKPPQPPKAGKPPTAADAPALPRPAGAPGGRKRIVLLVAVLLVVVAAAGVTFALTRSTGSPKATTSATAVTSPPTSPPPTSPSSTSPSSAAVPPVVPISPQSATEPFGTFTGAAVVASSTGVATLRQGSDRAILYAEEYVDLQACGAKSGYTQVSAGVADTVVASGFTCAGQGRARAALTKIVAWDRSRGFAPTSLAGTSVRVLYSSANPPSAGYPAQFHIRYTSHGTVFAFVVQATSEAAGRTAAAAVATQVTALFPPD